MTFKLYEIEKNEEKLEYKLIKGEKKILKELKKEDFKFQKIKDLNQSQYFKKEIVNNQLYLETSLEDIYYYKKNNTIFEKVNKDKKNGINVEYGTICQSKVRPYLKNFLMIKESGILVSEAYHLFYNENFLICEYLYILMSQNKYMDYIEENSDNKQKPEISFKKWENFEFLFPKDINDLEILLDNIKIQINEIKQKKIKIETMLDLIELTEATIIKEIFESVL